MWNFADGFSDVENKENALQVKRELEALTESIKEIVELSVHINEIPTGNTDIMLDSLFENEETMAAYKIHPEHQRVAKFIETVLQNRVCFDYRI
jgi:hypothetical protein